MTSWVWVARWLLHTSATQGVCGDAWQPLRGQAECREPCLKSLAEELVLAVQPEWWHGDGDGDVAPLECDDGGARVDLARFEG